MRTMWPPGILSTRQGGVPVLRLGRVDGLAERIADGLVGAPEAEGQR